MLRRVIYFNIGWIIGVIILISFFNAEVFYLTAITITMNLGIDTGYKMLIEVQEDQLELDKLKNNVKESIK